MYFFASKIFGSNDCTVLVVVLALQVFTYRILVIQLVSRLKAIQIIKENILASLTNFLLVEIFASSSRWICAWACRSIALIIQT